MINARRNIGWAGSSIANSLTSRETKETEGGKQGKVDERRRSDGDDEVSGADVPGQSEPRMDDAHTDFQRDLDQIYFDFHSNKHDSNY